MAERGALATAEAIRRGETSALAACDAAVAAIEERDGAINAVVVRDFDRARAQARAIDARIARGEAGGAFLGVPMTVKESFDVAGLRTTWGFAEHREHFAREDAVAVKRLKAAGAVILGKTNVPTGLADLQSINPIYGRTNHPFDASLTPGGSSGGAAAALAAGMVPLEVGSDIGGSIRVPSSFCGVWGLKPTYGLLSSEGHYYPGTDGARAALGVIGPMARSADDLAAALDVLARHPLPRADEVREPRGLRVLLLTEHPLARADAAIAGAIRNIGDALARDGAEVEDRTDLLPNLVAQHADYWKMLLIAMSRGAPQDGSAPASLTDWFDLHDAQARNARAWRRLFERYDAVIAPALGSNAYPHPPEGDMAQRTLRIDDEDTPFGVQFAWPGLATFPGLPAAAAPIGADARGLPIGAQFITDQYRDHHAIRVAALAYALAPTANRRAA